MSLEEIKSQLKDAIAEKQEEVLQKLESISADIDSVLEFVDSKSLNSELKVSVLELAEKLDLKMVSTSTNVKTADKIKFIRQQLEKNGEQTKAHLIKAAAVEFNCDPAPTFLDIALDKGPFEQSGRKNRSLVFKLAK